VNRIKNSSAKAVLTRSGMGYIHQYLWQGEQSLAKTNR
jgi:hypothetical protein